MEIRAIYLTTEDHDALDRAMSWINGGKCSVLQYRDHQIRRGNTSRIYSTFGVEIKIPKRLYPRAKVIAA